MGCILKGNSGLYSRMTVGAALLAAGAGARLGGRPKPLLELGGVPLILRQLIALSGAGLDEVVVVLGHHADAIEAAVRAFPITLVRNPRPDDGQPSSVRLGLQALSPKLDAVMVALADQPLLDAQDITALIGAYRNAATLRWWCRSCAAKTAANPATGPLRRRAARRNGAAGAGRSRVPALAAGASERVRWFETDNWRYRIDIDTPEDIERFAASTGHVLSWPALPEPPKSP
jgi:molybdenum cofactor cytidylyltransferase